MSKIIGVDLGTTNSCVAVMEGSAPHIITNSTGNRTTPSVVGFTDKERLVGQNAVHQQTTNPEKTVYSIKRFMGRRHSEVSDEEKLVPFKITGGATDPVKVKIGDKELTPPEISATILQDLKKSAEDYLGEKVEAAVITVPAYFNDAQRKATKEAGEIAGFDVKRVLPEPTAAALAFGVDKKKSGKIAVFDLGGGTFDISILDIGEGIFETLAINGNSHLGGDDYDEILIVHVADEFRKKEGVDLCADSMAHQRLKEACEKAKKELSTAKETTINLPFITATDSGAKHLQTTITRAKFEQLTEELTKSLRQPCLDALKDAKLTPGEIDECLLIGGSTRMPSVHDLCKEIFQTEPNKSINPDEAVAAGAAIQAGILMGDVKDILVLDVTPLTLGVETMGSVMTPMIPRNTTIPTSKKETYSTATNNQTEVTIHVLQGERPMAQDCRTLGRFNLTGLAPAPRGMPQIEVTFDIDANGILSVSAKDTGTGAEQNITIEGSSGLTDEEVERMTREAEENADADKSKKETVDMRNQADAMIHASDKSIQEHGDKISSEELAAIESATNNLKEQVKSDDGVAIKKSMDELSNAMQVIGKVIYEQTAQAQATAAEPADVRPSDDDVIDVESEVKG